MTKFFTVLFFLIFSIVTLHGLESTQSQTKTLKKVHLQLQWKYQFQFAGFIMAKEKGFYKDVGLDVSLDEYDGTNMQSRILNNSVSYFLQNSPLLYKNKKLLDVKLLATYFQHSPLVLVTQPDIKSVEELLGKKIMIGSNDLKWNALGTLLSYYHINAQNSDFISPSFKIEDFLDNKVDASSIFRTDQLFEVQNSSKAYNVIDPASYGFVTNANNLFVTRKKLQEDPQEIENFLSASKKGWKYALSHIDESVHIIKEKYKSKKSIEALLYEAKETQKLMLLKMYEIGEINRANIISIYQQLIKAKRLEPDKVFEEEFYVNNMQAKVRLTEDENNYLQMKKEIKICVDPVWKPFEWIDENGVYKGMGADYLEKFKEILDVDISLYKTKNWAETIAAIKSKKCDLLPMASITKERKAFVNFTTPYYKAPYVIATTSDKTFIEDIAKKLDKRYAVVKDSAIFDDLSRMYPSIKLREVDDILEGLQLVNDRKVFGFINITTAIAYSIQKENMVNIKIAGQISDGFKIAVATRKDEPLLGSIFQKAIDNVDKMDAEIIQNRWLSTVVEERTSYKLVYEVLLFSALLLLALFYRHILLKRINSSLELKVKAKTKALTLLNENLEKIVQQRTEALEYQAYYDSLTGLPNRVLFNDRLEQAIQNAQRTETKVALFYIDIDRFKQINDSLGHDVGDKVLQMVSQRLVQNLRSVDTLSRLGGDEFTLIVNQVHTLQDAAKLAQTLLDALSQTFEIDEHTLYVSSSIGISLYPEDDTQAKNLVKYADAAMYSVKKKGRNNYQFYSREMTAMAYERVVLQSSLHQAIKNKEFIVHYQPQIDAVTHKIIGVEALVRWMHPSEGLIAPNKFIPIAEESGLVVDIDRLVMEEAMDEVKNWHAEGLFDGTLSLNLAAKQLEEKDYLQLLTLQLKAHDFKPQWLELEITESDIMNKPDQAIEKLNKIHSLGIKISVDDFGTGYSSLSYLKRFPIDKLKIDRSFVIDIPDDEDDSAIVLAIIALANSLGISLIAEGVEEKAQKDFLVEHSCVNIQGYFYSKPLPAKEMKKFLKSF